MKSIFIKMISIALTISISFGVDKTGTTAAKFLSIDIGRSEERRVGKECRSRWSPYH